MTGMKESLADSVAESVAAERATQVFRRETIDALLAEAKSSGTPIDGVDGLLNQLTKAVLERALAEELTDHLGYAPGDPAGHGSGNSRNGYTGKTVSTTAGPIRLAVPRDRNGSFEPTIVPKGTRRVGRIEDLVLSLYSRGMTNRDIQDHLGEIYGINASPALISRITDVVADEIVLWQNRPVEEVYPIVYVDALRVRIRDKGAVTIKAAYLVVGVDVEGRKHVLGAWLEESESAKFWNQVLTQLRNRGLKDILILCCDGLTGLPNAARAVFPNIVIQTCVVHLLRNAMAFVSYADRKHVAAAMRAIYTAPSVEAAEVALDEFRTQYGKQYPGSVAVWERAWPEFIPFLDYPPELRKVVYTTNLIESINYQLRKITKTRGHFPNDDAAMKLLYLGIRNISTQRGGEAGTGTWGWKQALNTLVVLFPGRLPNN